MRQKIVQPLQQMNEKQAKETLYQVFEKIDMVNTGGYTREQCLKDIEDIYHGIVTYPKIFGDKDNS